MSDFAEIFKYIIETNIINFALMVWFFCWICKKINIGKNLEKLADSIKDKILKSDEEKDNSKATLKKSLDTLNNLPKKIKEIEDFNKQKTETFEKQLEQTTQKTISNIKKNVDKVISLEEKRVSYEIVNETIVKSIDKSKNDILNMLKTNPEMHFQFIDESLEKLDRTEI